MIDRFSEKCLRFALLAPAALALAPHDGQAGGLFQPPGANLTYGDVTHGARVQSASGNPAAAAADLGRTDRPATRGTVVSGAAGLEYGNVDNLFELIDQVTASHEPSDPGDGGGGPGQNPEEKPPGGIDLGDIINEISPDFGDTIRVVAEEVGTQVALLALISVEGYGKAWLSGDAPFLVGREKFGGAWTFGANWYGAARAFGLSDPIQFNRDDALARLEAFYRNNPVNLPARIPLSDQVVLTNAPSQNSVFLSFDNNDTSLLTKSVRLWDLSAGYSRPVMQTDRGTLFAGVELHAYLMSLSRLSVRYGDITDSEELFDAIQNADFVDDNRLGVDAGVLWVSERYQLGAQLTSVNRPTFEFNDANLQPYSSQRIIDFLVSDKTYQMDAQLKLEGSVFSRDRRWSVHVGLDANKATDPLGDDFQWVTLAAGLQTQKWWAPSLRFGVRRNLAGTELGYLSVGATLFRYVNFDISSALDTTRIDGTELPRGLMASLGFQVTW